MTKTLTEQWREGTIPKGWYYCQCYNEVKKLYCGDGESLELDDPETAAYYFFHRKHEKGQVEVLAPVPSFDEYKELVRKSDKLDKIMSDTATNPGDCQQIVEDNLNRQIARLQKQLEIATKALKEYERCENGSYAHKALALIKEVK